MLIYLKVPVDILWERVRSQILPAYLDQFNAEKEFYELANIRSPIIEKAANFTLEIDSKNVDEAAQMIAITILKQLNQDL